MDCEINLLYRVNSSKLSDNYMYRSITLDLWVLYEFQSKQRSLP
jgi:hypothetical protein